MDRAYYRAEKAESGLCILGEGGESLSVFISPPLTLSLI